MALNERGNSFGRMQSLSQNSFRNLMDLSGREADYAGTDRQDALQERGARSEAERGANDVRGRQADFGRGASQDLYGREDDSYRRGVGERDAAQDYESRTFGQRRSQFGDLSGYEGDVRGSQRSDRGELRGERGFQAGERDRQYGIDRDQIDDQRSDRREQRGERDWQYGLDQDYQREQRGRRDEFRGERDYQYGLERDSIGDRERQFGLEQGAQNDDFNRQMRMAEFGYGQNPSSAYAQAGGRQGQQASDTLSGIGPMFGEWAQRRQRGRGRGGVQRQAQQEPYDPAAV
jgi:hypothetical protein